MRHFTSHGTDHCQKRFIKPPYSISRATSIDSECCRLPTASVLGNEADKSHAPTSFHQAQFLIHAEKKEIKRVLKNNYMNKKRRVEKYEALRAEYPWKKKKEKKEEKRRRKKTLHSTVCLCKLKTLLNRLKTIHRLRGKQL